jgi:uncharacterized protein with GYD domain
VPRYLIIANYTAEGAKGLLKEGGSARREAANAAVASVGGTLDAFYYGFGADDLYALVDFPDHAAAAAAALTIGSSGAVTIRTVVLITPEEIDAAAKLTPSYRPPGG